MINFLKLASIGAIHLGMHRSEIVANLGEPLSWLGKPPVFGTAIPDWRKSEGLLYYNSMVTVFFDPAERAAAILIRIHGQQFSHPLFDGWPPLQEWRIRQLLDWMKEEQIEVFRSEIVNYPMWIAAGRIKIMPWTINGSLGKIPEDQHAIMHLMAFENLSDLEFHARFMKFRWTSSDSSQRVQNDRA